MDWISIFGDVCQRFNWVCHSYCQMDNHYHIILETPEANLSRGMRHLNGVYAQAFNHKHGLVGHLFQGRFKAILVEKESYLLELARYVPLNPVRVGKSKDAGEWKWSSYLALIGESPIPHWLETDWILSQFHSNRRLARKKFIDFVRSGVGLPSIWEELKYGLVLGSKKFTDELSQKYKHLRDLREVPRAQRRALAEPLEHYEREFCSRQVAIAEAYRSGGFTMKEIASHFRVHYTTVSRAVQQYKKHHEIDDSGAG